MKTEKTWFQVRLSGGFFSTYKSLPEAVNLCERLKSMGENPVIKVIVKQEQK